MTTLRQKYSNLNLFWRWSLAILGLLVIFVLIAQLLLSVFLDDYVGDYLKKQVRTSSYEIFSLEFEDIDIGLLGGSLRLENVRLRPDTSIYNQLKKSDKLPFGEADFNELRIGGFSMWAYLFQDKIKLGSILIDKPAIFITRLPPEKQEQPDKEENSKSFSSVDSTLFAAFSKNFSAFQLGRLSVRDGSFSIRERGKQDEGVASAGKLGIELEDIYVDSATAQSGRLFVTDDIEFNIRDFAMNLPDGLYTLKVGEFDISSSGSGMGLDSLELIPRFPKYEFAQVKGVQTDRIDLLVPEVSVQQIDFPQLIDSRRFYARTAAVNKMHMEDFRDKNLPFPDNNRPPLPHSALKDMKAELKIDTLRINDTFISYSEHVGEAPKAGTVTFEELNASIFNITNYPELIEKGAKITMDARAKIMGAGLLKAHFEFPMDRDHGFHTVSGTLGSMAIPKLNPILEYAAFIRADEGQINHLDFNMSLEDSTSSGSLVLNYENFKVSLLDKETIEQEGFLKDAGSFLANALVIKESNIEEPLREGTIEFERIQKKSVFNYWWKSLLTGLKDTIGI